MNKEREIIIGYLNWLANKLSPSMATQLNGADVDEYLEQQVKSVDLADVGERYLAIGTLSSGKSFRYEDNAVDMRAFANYINEIYPDFEVDAIIAT